jgi:hypothetical protein
MFCAVEELGNFLNVVLHNHVEEVAEFFNGTEHGYVI